MRSARPFASLVFLAPVAAALAGCPPPGPGGDGGDPLVDVTVGTVFLQQDRAPFWQATATFQEPAESGCVEEDVAGCTFRTCDGETPANPSPHLDAGDVTIENEAKSVTLLRDGEGRYPAERVDGEKFYENGVELIASALGGADVEAFSVILRAPTPLQITNPPLASVTVKLTDALPIEWTGSSSGEVLFTLKDAAGAPRATCVAPSTGGAFAVPAEVIGRFPVGSGSLDIIGLTSATADLPNARHVTFTTFTPATSAVGVNASYFVTFAAP